jgi:hypothetical protein
MSIVVKMKCINVNKFEDRETVRFTTDDLNNVVGNGTLNINLLVDDDLFEKYVPGVSYDVTLALPE